MADSSLITGFFSTPNRNRKKQKEENKPKAATNTRKRKQTNPQTKTSRKNTADKKPRTHAKKKSAGKADASGKPRNFLKAVKKTVLNERGKPKTGKRSQTDNNERKKSKQNQNQNQKNKNGTGLQMQLICGRIATLTGHLKEKFNSLDQFLSPTVWFMTPGILQTVDAGSFDVRFRFQDFVVPESSVEMLMARSRFEEEKVPLRPGETYVLVASIQPPSPGSLAESNFVCILNAIRMPQSKSHIDWLLTMASAKNADELNNPADPNNNEGITDRMSKEQPKIVEDMSAFF